MGKLMQEFDYSVAGIAWNAWSELGVAGTERFYENCLIQPEELIILTTVIAQSDPRLRDEALDWSSRYHQFVSVSRLKTLLKNMGSEVEDSFSLFAAALNSVSSAKWPSTNAKVNRKLKLSGKSIMTTLESASLLMFRFRNLFGPGAKADILTHFLTRNGMLFSASDLSEVGYSKRSLMTALDSLAISEVIKVTNVRNKKVYELQKSKELQVIVGRIPKIAPPWVKILQAIAAIRAIIPSLENSTAITRGIILRNCLIKIESLLPYFISPILYNQPDFERDWKSVIDIFKAFQKGNFHTQFEVYDEIDRLVIQLLRNLFPVDDCVDGIEMIQSKKELKVARHSKIYKECYQLFLSFINDLKVGLGNFFGFPLHRMMDETLADISFQFSKEKLPNLIEKMNQIQSIDQITSTQSAIRQYQQFMPELDILRQFMNTFRNRLADLYFIKTKAHLLTLPEKLYKRHLVRKLFSEEAE
jgi:hypothetical protein